MRPFTVIFSIVGFGMLPAAAGLAAAVDPGVRSGAGAAGQPIAGLTTSELAFFNNASDAFQEAEGLGQGLGPRFNLDSCGGCHSTPALGGTSPAVNPQVNIATAFGARNVLPSFISSGGPIREARFRFTANGRDGGVHALFVVSGRVDSGGNASNCPITQDNFAAQLALNNVTLRIPTPVFGAGLIEQIPDKVILANLRASAELKERFGIAGHPNRNGNDGTITRFGWKAQNKSLLLFAGEAYNVEMGLTSEIFQTERDETPGCQFIGTPNNRITTDAPTGADTLSDIEKFALFMRFLAPPLPSLEVPGGSQSIANGRLVFARSGCALCHTPTLQTANAAVTALSKQNVNLFSDLALHHMGPGLADYIQQGSAADDEFRTAPLWGLGQRLFFLHDGRTSDLVAAIEAHRSNRNGRFAGSEANQVIERYDDQEENNKQDLLNFLRSL